MFSFVSIFVFLFLGPVIGGGVLILPDPNLFLGLLLTLFAVPVTLLIGMPAAFCSWTLCMLISSATRHTLIKTAPHLLLVDPIPESGSVRLRNTFLQLLLGAVIGAIGGYFTFTGLYALGLYKSAPPNPEAYRYTFVMTSLVCGVISAALASPRRHRDRDAAPSSSPASSPN